MKLRNIIFLLSCAVVLPQMSYGMERLGVWIEEPPKTKEKKPEMTKAEKILANVEKSLKMRVEDFKRFGITPGEERKLESLKEEIRSLKEEQLYLKKSPEGPGEQEGPGEMEQKTEPRQEMEQEHRVLSKAEAQVEVELESEVKKFMKQLEEKRELEQKKLVVFEEPEYSAEGGEGTKEEVGETESRKKIDPRRSKKVWGVPEKYQPHAGLAMGAAIIGAAYLYKKAPQWRKDFVKGIMHEHGKKLSDTTPAERDLLMAAYTRFIPSLVASFRFKRAAARMPLDEEFSEELWPVLYRLYYGKQKTTRKQKRELKKMYDDAREQVRAAAQKVAHNKRRRRVKRKIA